jgi:phosphopantothenoylcysteine decarboxylase/phosphopantothenate--cysteine ligase
VESPGGGGKLRTLGEPGRAFVDPGEGYLACGWVGKGRLAEPEAIVESLSDWHS